jgi:hypothetical protein
MLGGVGSRLQTTRPGWRARHAGQRQHILIGAYAQTLRLMQQVGIDPAKSAAPAVGDALCGWQRQNPARRCAGQPLNAVAAIATARLTARQSWPWKVRVAQLATRRISVSV